MTFLHLACPQGWVFDQQPGGKRGLRMMEAEVEQGLWHYVVSAESGVALRTRCSFSEDTKCGKGPLKGALLEITQRVRVGETTFLQLKDSGRWIFDGKGAAFRKVLSGPWKPEEPVVAAEATVRAANGVYLRQSPTKQKWAVGKMLLLQHAKVSVTKFFEAEFCKWGFVSKPGSNMEGWVNMDDLRLEDPSSSLSGLRSAGSKPCEVAMPVALPSDIQDTQETRSVQKTFTKAQCQEAVNGWPMTPLSAAVSPNCTAWIPDI